METQRKESARYPEARANREATGEGLLAVLADHSSDGLESYLPGLVRWGSETQATHCSEGEAGHNVSLWGTMGNTQGLPTISPKLKRIAELDNV